MLIQTTAMKLTICLVEDSEERRLLVRSLLDGRCDLIEFEDGPSAIAALKIVHADLVLLDMSLPGMQSTEVLSSLRDAGETSALPVIGLVCA